VFRIARSRHKDARDALSNLILGSALLKGEEALLDLVPRSTNDTAMIQFTSGSTGDPKGVVLSHRALLANMRGIGIGAKFRGTDVAVSWLPLFHDMGLIGHFLGAVAWGMPLVLLPPEKFIRRPKEWLKAISKYKGACSAAPNFAYSLCAKKIKDRDLEGVDLSSWRVALCGAEPISANTVNRFIDRFSPYGFGAGTFFPVYGMAEFSLAATFPPPGRPPKFDRVDRTAFEGKGQAVPKAETEDEAETILWISVGMALPGGHGVRVVDTDGASLPERRVGEIEVRGPSLMDGYYNAPLATVEAMHDGWLRTGDLGYVADGELYVTGRRKEIIIKGGKNLFPQDVEIAAAKVKGVRLGCCAAFGLRNEKRGTEDMLLICETRIEDEQQRGDMKIAIRAAVLEATGATPDVILLVAPGVVPKTSSGKIQRALMRRLYVAGDLRPARPSVFTLARLKLAQAIERVKAMSLPGFSKKKN
jgi:acyl-CoA synthetase (AMP-forming)/AMP-acid ligase II